jgi:hypothetical protein
MRSRARSAIHIALDRYEMPSRTTHVILDRVFIALRNRPLADDLFDLLLALQGLRGEGVRGGPHQHLLLRAHEFSRTRTDLDIPRVGLELVDQLLLLRLLHHHLREACRTR